MNFKLSQTTKDFFDIIRTYGSILSIAAIGISIVLFTIDEQWLPNFFKNHKIWAYVIGGILVIPPLLLPLINKWINIYLLKKKKLSNIITERQDVVIDIVDGGRTASYYERMCFHKLGKGNKNQHINILTVTGKIDTENIHSLNCFYNLNNEKNRLIVSYVNNSKKKTNNLQLVNGNEKFLIYSLILKDTFIGDEENWDLIPINYCMFYNLTISFPEGKKLLYAKLYKKENGSVDEILDMNPIIISENNRSKLILQLINYDYGEFLSVRWKLV